MASISSLNCSRVEDSRLVLILHAFAKTPANMRFVASAIDDLLPSSHVIVPQLSLSRFSFETPLKIARSLVNMIDEQTAFRATQGWAEFNEIILIGHSMGALLARKVYLLAGPESAEARFEDSIGGPLQLERPWFRKVSRIILFAGMNRGWSLTPHVRIFRFLAWWVSTFAAETLMAFTKDRLRLAIMNIRRGAPFLTELRLQWLALQRTDRQLRKQSAPSATPLPDLAITIQMLGTVDDMVAPSDNVDLATGRDFIYLDVPRSGHSSVVMLDASPEGAARLEVFRTALCDSPSQLRRRNLVPADEALLDRNDKVTDVVFVMHGIRDTGYWTQKVARKVEELGGAPPKIYASETSSYGYFAMISFLLPSQRRKKVQWMMDQYVEARSLYPEARFSYVGHSNGTYLVARALIDYPACRFDRIVFAGSVVRTDYDWAGAIARGQVEAVLNYVATADLIVAVLPGAWEMVNLQDIGSAGHNGFRISHPQVFQSKFIRGGHSSAREEDNWSDIASFIVSPTPSLKTSALIQPRQSTFTVAMGRTAPLIWAATILSLIAIGRGVFWLGLRPHIQHPYLFLFFYVWVIWQILSKV